MASIVLRLFLLCTTITITTTTTAFAPSPSPITTRSPLPLSPVQPPTRPQLPPPILPPTPPPVPPPPQPPVLPPNAPQISPPTQSQVSPPVPLSPTTPSLVLPPTQPPVLQPNPPPVASPTHHLQQDDQEPPQQLQLNIIINAIFTAGNFDNWANLLSQTSATLFIPNDAVFTTATSSHHHSSLNFLDPLLFTYHIIPRRFTFSELLVFPTGAHLPTLLTGKTLVITNNSAVNFTVNGVPLTDPDLFQNAAVSVHGIDGVLDYSLFGSDNAPPQRSSETVKRSPSPPVIGVSEIAVNRSEPYSPVNFQTTAISSPPVTEFSTTSAASSWVIVSFLLLVLCFLGFDFG